MGPDNIEEAVTDNAPAPKASPQLEYRRWFLSLRWLLIVLASVLTVFTTIGSGAFAWACTFIALFAATNIAAMVLPSLSVESEGGRKAITICDGIFVLGTYLLLSPAGSSIYLAFMIVFLLATVYRDLRLSLISLLAVSVLYGILNSFKISQFNAGVNVEQFLALALFFVVSTFYVFFSDLLRRNSELAAAILLEKRNAEVMVEIARGLASSLKVHAVLRIIANRLGEVLNAEDCSIIEIDTTTGKAQVIVRTLDASSKESTPDVTKIPELKEAYESRKIVFRKDAGRGVAAVPMVAHDSVLGLIHVVGVTNTSLPSEAAIRFFELAASTAANALRNAQLFEEVEHRARTDFLTGLPNHRHFQLTLSAELGRAQRQNHPLSLLIIDLDYLKVVNDRFGHPSGDLVIRTIGQTIRSTCRDFDFAARYGGEEFTVILPETPLEGAIVVADRMRATISQTEFEGIGSITASIGVSNYPLNALTKEDLIRIADQALYIAKDEGRNRIAHFNYQLITK